MAATAARAPQGAQMAPTTPAEPQPAHGARAETGRQALLLAVQALGVNAERVQEAERKQAEAEHERDAAVQLLMTLLGKLEGVRRQDMLVLAAEKGSTAVVEKLLNDDDVDKDAEGSQALEEEELQGETALVAAAWRGQTRCLELLLAAGADADKVNWTGSTPLISAACYGHLACVERLLEAGADKDAQNADGSTALRCAAYNGNEAVVEVLLAAGCSVDLPTNDGMTPLMFAARFNHAGTVKILLEAGADKTLVDRNERTALSYAEQNGHDTVAALLRG